MNTFTRVLAIAACAITVAQAQPNYYNYVIIDLTNNEAINLLPITGNGSEGTNYLLEGELANATIKLRAHSSSDAMISLSKANAKNQIELVAHPEVLVDSSVLRSLLVTELNWLKSSGIVNLTDNAISTAITLIMNKKLSGGAVKYSTLNNSADALIGGPSDIQYELPPSQLIIGGSTASKAPNQKTVPLTQMINVICKNSVFHVSTPSQFIGAQMDCRLFNLQGSLIAQKKQNLKNSSINFGRSIKFSQSQYILQIKNGNQQFSTKIL